MKFEPVGTRVLWYVGIAAVRGSYNIASQILSNNSQLLLEKVWLWLPGWERMCCGGSKGGTWWKCDSQVCLRMCLPGSPHKAKERTCQGKMLIYGARCWKSWLSCRNLVLKKWYGRCLTQLWCCCLGCPHSILKWFKICFWVSFLPVQSQRLLIFESVLGSLPCKEVVQVECLSLGFIFC